MERGRPRWWTQVALAVAFVFGYTAIRDLHGNVVPTALRHGRELLHIDRWLHLDWSQPLNDWANAHDSIADTATVYYVVMHFGAVSLMLLLLWLHGRHYRRERNILLLLSAIGLVVYWLYPAAPPRLLAGATDTVANHLPAFASAERSDADIYASMPSLHMAWAVWVAMSVRSLTRRRSIRWTVWLHPLLTATAVLMTDNHYTIDLLAGTALTLISYPLYAALVPLAVRTRSHLQVKWLTVTHESPITRPPYPDDQEPSTSATSTSTRTKPGQPR